MNDNIAVSVIGEIELLGWHKITTDETAIIRNLLDNCFIIELIPAIKEIAIRLKQKNKLKLPDAVVAATAIHLNVALLTADKAMAKIDGLIVLLLEL